MFRVSDFRLRRKKNKNRNSLEIIRDMLSAATENRRKTRLMYEAHLNYRLLEKYLKILLENGLLKRVEDSRYLVTWKGKNFLQLYDDYIERCRKIDEEIKNACKEKLLLDNVCFNNNSNSKLSAKEKEVLV